MREPDSKQANAFIKQIITDGDELGRLEAGGCAGERREGELLLCRVRCELGSLGRWQVPTAYRKQPCKELGGQ